MIDKSKNPREERPCRHKSCSECNGTGRKKDGTICVHMISCPCPRCNPYWMGVKFKENEYLVSGEHGDW